MTVLKVFGLTLLIAVVSTVPTLDPVIFKRSDGLRYQYRDDGEGSAHLVDQWFKISDAIRATRYNPDQQNIYHLFTRHNPSVSQPMLLYSNNLLATSNYNPSRRTIFIAHGWTQSASSNVIFALVPAFLQAEDVNVFAVDWSAGSGLLDALGPNTAASGLSMARAIDWIVSQTGANVDDVHLVGFSLGSHMVADAGRNIQRGRIPYITALDPANTLHDSSSFFSPDAAIYTEAIHTNAGGLGYGDVVAHSDFFSNNGSNQPGCLPVNFLCNHYRAFYLFAETLTRTTGFDAARCQTVEEARQGLCDTSDTVRMGGLTPKFGISGIFQLNTNAVSPFSPT